MADKCMNCGKEWPINLLDAKPGPGPLQPQLDAIDRNDPENPTAPTDFDWLEGPCCYGAGYVRLHS